MFKTNFSRISFRVSYLLPLNPSSLRDAAKPYGSTKRWGRTSRSQLGSIYLSLSISPIITCLCFWYEIGLWFVVYGDKIGSFERSFKSTRQRKLYLLRLLMKQFKAVQELLNDFATVPHSNTELSAKETLSSSARTTSWMKNEIGMHKQLSAVSRTRNSSAMSLTANERLLE